MLLDRDETRQITQRLQMLPSMVTKKLSSLIIQETIVLLDQVFMPTWMDDEDDEADEDGVCCGEGLSSPIKTVVSVVTQRFQYIQENLETFLCPTVVRMTLEDLVVQYLKSILFKKNVSNPPPLNQKTGFFSGMYQKAKQVLLPPHVHVDSESLARLALDVNMINGLLVNFVSVPDGLACGYALDDASNYCVLYLCRVVRTLLLNWCLL
jgi:hypothetical protein